MSVRTPLLFAGVALGSALATAALLGVSGMVIDATDGHEQRVPFSDLVIAVEMGRADEIAVRGRSYTFETHDSTGRRQRRWARGPAVTREEVLAWRSADPSLPAPHVVGP